MTVISSKRICGLPYNSGSVEVTVTLSTECCSAAKEKVLCHAVDVFLEAMQNIVDANVPQKVRLINNVPALDIVVDQDGVHEQ